MNDEAKVFRQERDELNAQIRGNLDNALKYRDERDQINQEVKKNIKSYVMKLIRLTRKWNGLLEGEKQSRWKMK